MKRNEQGKFSSIELNYISRSYLCCYVVVYAHIDIYEALWGKAYFFKENDISLCTHIGKGWNKMKI